MTNYIELEKKAIEMRKQLLQIIYQAKGGHTGGSLSSTDILTTLFFDVMDYKPHKPNWEDRDRFILSKGHSVEAYYCVLAEAGFFDKEILKSYGKFQSILAGHPTRKVPGVELNSGALGHGLSVGVGMALAAKMDHKNHRVFVLMGDGEQGEGSIMEAANSAGHYRLDNLIAIIDRNYLQISGKTEEVMSLENLKERWIAYNWHVEEADGHNFAQLSSMLNSYPVVMGKPHLLIAKTIKGKGVSFIEDKPVWHHKVPDENQLKQAIEELDKRMEEIENANE